MISKELNSHWVPYIKGCIRLSLVYINTDKIRVQDFDFRPVSRLQKKQQKKNNVLHYQMKRFPYFYLSGFTSDFIELYHKNILITLKTHLNSNTTKLTLEGNVFDYIFRGLVLKDGLI